MSGITSHILDTARGKPAAGVAVTLQKRHDGSGFVDLAHSETDNDGRIKQFAVKELTAGVYRLVFATERYFQAHGVTAHFYPEVAVTFAVRNPAEHHHVPLLLSPFGYSTYRGS